MSEPNVPQNISNAITRTCASTVLPEDVAKLREFCESLWRAGYWFSKAEKTLKEVAE